MECNKCKIEKNESEFEIRKSRNSKFNTICRNCVNKKRNETRCKNKEKYNEVHRKWYEQNKNKVKENNLKYQKDNKEKVNQKNRNWYWNNREKIINRRKENGDYKYNKEKRDENYKNELFRKKHITRTLLNRAIKDGKIMKSEFCQICGNKSRIDGHHHDYDKPLEVIWVCRKCHIKIHKNLEE